MKVIEANRILEAVHSNPDIVIDDATALRIQEAKKSFVSHYRGNARAFIEDFITILDGNTNEEIQFKFNTAQVLLVNELENSRWLAAPKARQLGITTLTNALALHHALFVNNANTICMAVKTDNAVENLRRIKGMFKSMPEWVQKTVMLWSKEEFLDNQHLWNFKSLITGSINKIEVSSASSEDSTRGKTPTFLHWTEVAFSDIAEDIFTSVFPALNRRQDSVIILESTGNGNNGFYYDICVGNKKGFGVVFMPWFLDHNYKKEVVEKMDYEYISDLMGVEETPDLTDEQLQWYQDTSETIGKAKCQQEYPINIEQVFQATSNSFFSARAQQSVVNQDPQFCFTMKHGLLTISETGAGQIYQPTDDTMEYILSLDPSSGIEDPSSFNVISPDGEEVAYWNEYLDPDQVVEVAHALGKYYNDATIVVERNGIGQYILQRLLTSKFYPHIYHGDKGHGILTSVATKEPMLATLQSLMTDGKLKFHNQKIREEMPTFRADTLKAEKGSHDDAVMSAALAAFVFKNNPPLLKVHTEYFREYGDNPNAVRRRFVC